MIEAELIKELDAATLQLNLWWGNKKDCPYPKKLQDKVSFLRGYLTAIKNLKNNDEVEIVRRRVQGEYYYAGRFVSKV